MSIELRQKELPTYNYKCNCGQDFTIDCGVLANKSIQNHLEDCSVFRKQLEINNVIEEELNRINLHQDVYKIIALNCLYYQAEQLELSLTREYPKLSLSTYSITNTKIIEQCYFVSEAISKQVSCAQCLLKLNNKQQVWKIHNCGHTYCSKCITHISNSDKPNCKKCMYQLTKLEIQAINSVNVKQIPQQQTIQQNPSVIKQQQQPQYENCAICQEQLDDSAIKSDNCMHMFHLDCIGTQLRLKWPQNNISFGFLKCSLCNIDLSFSNIAKLDAMIQKHQQYQQIVMKMALEQLNVENRLYDIPITDANSILYGQHYKYAMSIYQYFECHKCTNPYFGGARNCQLIQDDLNPTQLLCPDCRGVSYKDTCNQHSIDNIVYKCKFCCSVSVFYCWGSTHFCKQCHDKRMRNEQIESGNVFQQYPKCLGPGVCPIGGNHSPNGVEQAIGCALCMQLDSIL